MAPGDIDVLLTAEGTYPVVRGGVSTWCDLLVRRIEGVRYTLLTVMASPWMPLRYELPPNVHHWIPVPLWGTEDPAGHLLRQGAGANQQRRPPAPGVVQGDLLPVLARVINAFWEPADQGQGDVTGDFLHLHRLFQVFDYQQLMRDEAVWQWYAAAATERLAPRYGLQPTLQDLTQSLGWVYRFLSVLAVPLPAAMVTHTSAAAFCALPGVLAKAANQVPLLLTEHGVYLREQYNSTGRSSLTPFLKRALLGMVHTVSRSAYAAADVVAPVAAFNARWEREFGVPRQRIRVVYNGVDPTVYRPQPRPAGAPPTVVSVARIDPVKDLATLLRTAALVVRQRRDVRFVVYGGVSVPSYHQQLLELRSELGLTESFIFAGHTADVPSAYASGDVVALSSITEGFPYAVIEAMMCGRPVVATDVGGTREALGDHGILVPPRSPDSMASGILRVLDDPVLAQSLAQAGHRRALDLFTIGKFVGDYRTLYQELAQPGKTEAVSARQTLDRVRELVAAGQLDPAASLLQAAIRELDDLHLRIALLTELAAVQEKAGDSRGAGLMLARAGALAALAESTAS